MKQIFIAIFMTIFVFIFLGTNIFASSSLVIDKSKASGCQYVVIKEQRHFTWKIGCGDNLSTIQEDKNNSESLAHFRASVLSINKQIFGLTLSTAYFLIVIITVVLSYKTYRHMPKSVGGFIALLVGMAVYFMISTSINLNSAFQDTKYYYAELTD